MFDLKEYLEIQINGKISPKMKMQNQRPESYFRLRSELESKIIEETDFYTLFENVPLSELVELENYIGFKNGFVYIDKPTLLLVVIKALRDYFDNGESSNPKCLFLHSLYLRLKEELSYFMPFESQEDSFIDYMKTRNTRDELENARFTGEICIFCNSKDVHSYGKAQWKCWKCKRVFRRHER